MPKYRLTMEIDVDLNGEVPEAVLENLHQLARHAAAEGWFTGYSMAEVNTWDHRVEEYTECPE